MQQLSVFEIFDLSLSPDIDQQQLNREYARLILENHPDKFINATTDIKQLSQDNTAAINHAYHILSTPIKVYEYIINNSQSNNESVISDDAEIFDVMQLYEDLYEIDTIKGCQTLHNIVQKLYIEKSLVVRERIVAQEIMLAQQHMHKLQLISKLLERVSSKQLELELFQIK